VDFGCFTGSFVWKPPGRSSLFILFFILLLGHRLVVRATRFRANRKSEDIFIQCLNQGWLEPTEVEVFWHSFACASKGCKRAIIRIITNWRINLLRWLETIRTTRDGEL
jgi:hypothetical protein